MKKELEVSNQLDAKFAFDWEHFDFERLGMSKIKYLHIVGGMVLYELHDGSVVTEYDFWNTTQLEG